MLRSLRRWFRSSSPRTICRFPDRNSTARLPGVKLWLESLEDRIVPSAAISTDLPDYAPGQTATFTGSGFQAGEVVDLKVLNDSLTPPSPAGLPPSWTVTADAQGNFTTTWTCTSDLLGDNLEVDAFGESSGATAVATFTDADFNAATSDGTKRNTNFFFPAREDVYIEATAHSNLPAGNYWVEVIGGPGDSSGPILGVSTSADLTVDANGQFTNTSNGIVQLWSLVNKTSDGTQGFDFSTAGTDVYKVLITTKTDQFGNPDFSNDNQKDEFKVGTSTAVQNVSMVFDGSKFNDVLGDDSINGINADDTPLKDWTINLTGDSTQTTTTNHLGDYSFTVTQDYNTTKTYTINEQSNPLWTQTYGGGGYTFSITVDGSGNISTTIGGKTFAGPPQPMDFANFQDITISGTKYIDTTGQGLVNGQSPYTAGVTVTLTGTNSLGNTITLTTTTDSSGNYSFTTTGSNGLLAGTYTITETPPTDWIETDGQTYSETVDGGDSVTGVDFSDFQDITISGTKYIDTTGQGLVDGQSPYTAGVTVTLTGTNSLGNTITLTTTTDKNGNYSFTTTGSNGLLAGTYTITETPPTGWIETDGQTYSETVYGGDSVTGVDFSDFQDITISGTKYIDTTGKGLVNGQSPYTLGVTVTLTGTNSLGNAITLTTTTDSSGRYSFTTTGSNGLLAGTYTITETPPAGWIETDGKTYSETVYGSSSVTGVNFSDFQDISISGTKYIDTTGKGLVNGQSPYTLGVTVTLTGTNSLGNTITLTTTTDSSGKYSFTTTGSNGLLAGTYTITETPPTGWIETDGKTYSETVYGGSSVTGVNFSDFQDISISGTKYIDTTGKGLVNGQSPYNAGVTVTLTGTNSLGNTITLTTTTDSSGKYSFTTTGSNGLLAGTYTITETPPTGWIETDGKTYSKTVSGGSTVTGVNFSDFQDITISGTKYIDTTGQGLVPGESPYTGGVLITLTGTNSLGKTITLTITTDKNGNYSFTTTASNGLLAGTYTLKETPPAGWIETDGKNYSETVSGGSTITGVNFSDAHVGAKGSPLTKGYWANHTSNISQGDINYLNTLNLRNLDGSLFTMTGSLNNQRSQLSNFLLGANSSNPANQLSAQLAAMVLNVRHGSSPAAGDTNLTGVSGTSVVYDPALAAFASALNTAPTGNPSTGGVGGPGFLSGGGFITVNNLITATAKELSYFGKPSQSQLQYNGVLAYNFENELENVLDNANNNKNFVI
jgi:5-hydroxyisourate hydrolase-like protein (transthyretin family)